MMMSMTLEFHQSKILLVLPWHGRSVLSDAIGSMKYCIFCKRVWPYDENILL